MCSIVDGNKTLVENTLYEIESTIVRKWFGNGRYGRLGIIGDGSCFFHSIAFAVSDLPNIPHIELLRDYRNVSTAEKQQKVWAWRVHLQSLFTIDEYEALRGEIKAKDLDTYEEHHKDLGIHTSWADEMSIKFVAKILKINVMFLNFSNNKNNVFCGVRSKSSLKRLQNCQEPDQVLVVVAWVDHSHFELVVRFDSIENDFTTIRVSYLDSERDYETIYNLLRGYTSLCE